MGLLGSAYFAGWTSAAIMVPRLADLYGRKFIWLLAMLFQAPAIFGLIASDSVLLTQVLLFVMGLCAAGRVSVGFLYVMEVIPTASRGFISFLLGSIDCMTMIYATVYFKYLTHDSIYWELFSGCQNILMLILVLYYLPESPRWLYEKGQYQKAKETLIMIANKNGVDGSVLRDCEFTNETSVEAQELVNDQEDSNDNEDSSLV